MSEMQIEEREKKVSMEIHLVVEFTKNLFFDFVS
jgi:hypothetical protein